MNSRITGRALLLTAAVAVMPQYAGAENSLSCKCKTWLTPEETYEHNFNLNGTLEYQCGYSIGTVDYPCHVDMIEGSCSTHLGCGEDPPDNLAAVTELAGRRSASYNADRGTLQLVDCEGRVAANIPVSPGELVAVLEILALRYLV